MSNDLRKEALNVAIQYNGAYENVIGADRHDYPAKNSYIATVNNKVRPFLAKHPEYIELFPAGIMRESDPKKLGLADLTKLQDSEEDDSKSDEK